VTTKLPRQVNYDFTICEVTISMVRYKCVHYYHCHYHYHQSSCQFTECLRHKTLWSTTTTIWCLHSM